MNTNPSYRPANRAGKALRTVGIAAAAGALVACSGPGRVPHVASLPTSAASTPSHVTSGSTPATHSNGADPATLVDQWAACERRHGDPTQADPVIDAHGVINIVIPRANGGPPVVTGGPETASGTCSRYLAAAQRALRAANPIAPPPSRSELISYVTCMRANGVPDYPYPTGEKANFNGTGVDPNSPQFERANTLCGRKLHLPAWWVNGWGPPGDVSVESAGLAQLVGGGTGSDSGSGSGG